MPIVPSERTFRSARSRKSAAIPALPSARGGPPRRARSTAPIAFCVALSVPKAAKGEFPLPFFSPSWPTGRVKGGFMITRSNLPCWTRFTRSRTFSGFLPARGHRRRLANHLILRRLHRFREELQRADACRPVRLLPIGHGEEAFTLERGVGVTAGEHRGGEVDGDVEHIEADEAVLHHGSVQSLRVAAMELVEKREALIGGGEQRTGAAGEVANLGRLAESRRRANRRRRGRDPVGSVKAARRARQQKAWCRRWRGTYGRQ